MSIMELERLAAAAWSKYDSTVRLGGTPQERIWSFNQWLAAEARLALRRGRSWPTVTV